MNFQDIIEFFEQNWRILAFFGVIIIGGICSFRYHAKIWNKGICRDCNTPWKFVTRHWHSEAASDEYVCGCTGQHKYYK